MNRRNFLSTIFAGSLAALTGISATRAAVAAKEPSLATTENVRRVRMLLMSPS